MDFTLDESQWKEIGRIEELMYFPIKSCRGIALESVECTTLGVKVGNILDRAFVLVDENGGFVCNFKEPNLMNVKPIVPENKPSELWVDAPGKDILKINVDELKKDGSNNKLCKLKETDTIFGIDCGEEISEWFSTYLNQDYTLLYFNEKMLPRFSKIVNAAAAMHAKDTDAMTFSNTTPYNILSQASMNDLNTKFTQGTIAERFRPNICIGGTQPYEEDQWKFLRVNDVRFRFIKLCQRCRRITVDPVTATRDKNYEPMKLLRSYRQTNDAELRKIIKDTPTFGVNFGIDQTGKINVGDTCYAILK